MPTETDPVVVRIIASQKDLEKSLATAVRSVERTAAKMEKTLSGIGGGGTAKVVQFGNAAAKSTQQATFAAQQLSFQLNDIGTSLTGGASPFQVMMQQGSQVAQVMQQVRAQGGSLGSVVAAAFTSMLNPIALVSFGLIAVAGYAYQYFTAVEEGAEDSNKELKKQQDALQRVVKAWGDQLPTLKAIYEARQKLLDQAEKQTVAEDEVANAYKGLGAAVAAMLPDIVDAQTTLEQMGDPEAANVLRAAYDELAKKIKAGTATAADLAKVINPLMELFKTTHLTTVSNYAAAFAGLATQINAANDAAVKLRFEALEKNLPALGTLTPLESGGGQFLNPEQMQRFRAANAEVNAELQKTMDLIAKEEGFIPFSKWDSNAFRTGFGSDTITDAFGNVSKVTKDTVTTVEDATRDLARRALEFQSVIRRQIGPEFWASFNEQQKAALTSIAYNYGSLPDSIVAAIKSGGGADKVASAIASLSANPERRKREAAAFGGSGFSQKEANTDLADWNAKLKESMALQREANTISQDTTRSVDERKAAIEEEKLFQEGLNAAIAQYGVVSAAQRESIRATAHEAAQLGLVADQIATAQKNIAQQAEDQKQRAQEMSQAITQMAQSALGGFVNDLRNGVEAGEAFGNMLDRVVDSIIQFTIQQMFAKNALGGLFGGFLGGGFPGAPAGGLYHGGGTVGLSAQHDGRRFPPSVWNGAPRYATGGVAGLRPGEIPAILHKGELVIPRGARTGARGAPAVTQVTTSLGDINMDMSQTGMVAATNEDAKQFGLNVQKIVQREMVRESRPGGLLRQVP